MITKAHILICIFLIFSVSMSMASEEQKLTYFGPGDSKHGYESRDYETRSLSLTSRTGKQANLFALMKNPPLGLPPVPQAEGDQVTNEIIQLGRRLFYDRRLSFNDTFSCGMCHIPEQGFTNNEISAAVGVEGRSGKRNSPTIYNVAYLSRLFHDGREASLETQAWAPLLAHNEMANPSVGYVIEKINSISDYDNQFEHAFDGKGPSMETVGIALAAYQRTLISANSRFDRWYFGGEETALNDKEKQGFKLFTGKGKCSACHIIEDQHATFTDNDFHNTGMGYETSMGTTGTSIKRLIAPGIYMDIPMEVIESVKQQPRQNDLGRYEITQNPSDRWKYRTPSLRNITLTAPYMHNGSLLTLHEVVDFYNQGGIPNDLLSPLIKPLNLTDEEVDALVSFLQTLTGDNIQTIVADAFDVPIGDIRDHDPHWSKQLSFNEEQ